MSYSELFVADEIRKRILLGSPHIPDGQFGAISFIQRFGSTLNYHPHFHLLVADGVFDSDGDKLLFFEATLTPDDIADTEDAICRRVLKLFVKRTWFSKDDQEKILNSEHSVFSLHATVRIEAWDTDSLERLIRYCARPSFSAENIQKHKNKVIYRLKKPSHTGQTQLKLSPFELFDRISALIPPPRKHRRHYHGVFAPNAPLRPMVAASAKMKSPEKFPSAPLNTKNKSARVSLKWAELIAHIYEVNPLLCTNCGKEMKISGFVTNPPDIRRILLGLGWPTEAPDFDPPYDYNKDPQRLFEGFEKAYCQLVPGSKDGFPSDDQSPFFDTDTDCQYPENKFLAEFEEYSQLLPGTKDGFPSDDQSPFFYTDIDPQYTESNADPPYLEDYSDPPYKEESYHTDE